MPELPEVETMRRGIAEIAGSTIGDVFRPPCHCRPIAVQPRIDAFARRVKGREIESVGRIGKRVSVLLDGGNTIVFEPRMTGLVLVADPPTVDHLRLQFDLNGKLAHLWFWDRRGLGSVRLFSPDQLAVAYGPGKLGPDALEISVEDLRSRLKHSRRAVKVALLDQKAVAGIGNLYAAEILNVAQVSPRQRCDRVTRRAWTRIHAAMVHVLDEAIRYEGSTLSDGTYRNALNKAGGYQNQHRVYDRAGKLCGSCGEGVVCRIVQAQRATFYCPRCQTGAGCR